MKFIWNFANFLTILRILLAPIFIISFLYFGITGIFVALIIAILFEITDALDGYIARNFNQASDMGKLLDPMADCMSRFTCFVTFVAAGLAPLWIVIIFFYRDIMVAYLRSFLASKGVVMGARASGKIKAFAQGAAILGVILVTIGHHYGFEKYDYVFVSQLMVSVAALVTLWSGLDYLIGFQKAMSEKSTPE